MGCGATFRDRRHDYTEPPHETLKERGNSGGVVLLAAVVGGSEVLFLPNFSVELR